MKGRLLVVTTLVAVVALAVVAASFGSSRKTAAPSFTPVTSDTLTVATEVPFPGFVEGNDPEHVNGGLDWALSELLAKKLGLHKVVFKNVDFSALVAGQVHGYDVAVEEVYVTPQRQKINLYSKCYRHAYIDPIVKKGIAVGSLADLQKINWAVETGSGGESILLDDIKPSHYKSYPSVTQIGVQLLKTGKVDGIFAGLEDIGSILANPWVKAHYYVPVKIVQKSQPNGICIAIQLPKGQTSNLQAVNTQLTSIMNSGIIHTWERKYLPWGFVNTAKLKTITIPG